MTIAALVGVGVLAAQAAATAPSVSATAGKNGTATAQPSTSTSAAAGGGSGSTAADPNALPANSGTGARIVYGEAAKRVWLVNSSNAVARTMLIVPGTVAVPTGTYQVTNKLSSVTGTDGLLVQFVVLFGKIHVDGASIALGFDAVANVTGLPPAPTSRTGAVRMAQADAQALFTFSSTGTTVVVVS